MSKQEFFSVMAKQANRFVFFSSNYGHIDNIRHEALSKKINTDDGIRKNIVACLFSVHVCSWRNKPIINWWW